MRETKDFISRTNFETKNENGNLVSFNGNVLLSYYQSKKFENKQFCCRKMTKTLKKSRLYSNKPKQKP